MRAYPAVLIVVIIIAAFAFVIQNITGMAVQKTSLWRPLCESAQPQPPWKENYNEHKALIFCLQADGAMYFQLDTVEVNEDGIFTRSDFPDAYINNIGYDNSPFPIGDRENGVLIEFEYFIPFHENNHSLCMNETPAFGQVLYISNDDAEDFGKMLNAARYLLTKEERKCSRWLLFNHSAADFLPEEGSSFSHADTRLGAIDFEFANVYVRDIWVRGSGGEKRIW